MSQLTCPDCGVTRTVSRSRLSLARLGKQSARCHPCAMTVAWAVMRARTEKRCGTCHVVQPLASFHRCRSHRDGRASRCIDCSRAHAIAYYAANREAGKERVRQWVTENIERRREIANAHARRFRRAHPERAKQRKDRTDFAAILEEYGLVCHICGDAIDPVDLHFDHVIPLSRGGAHSRDNILPSHSRCNLSKGTKLMAELAA